MKKIIMPVLLTAFMIVALSGCGEKGILDPEAPVTMTMWHVYGEQADSPMNELVAEFNETVGLEKGIIIDITTITNSSDIGGMLLDSQADKPGTEEMPDLFFCHTNNAAALGVENLLDWKEVFSEEELDGFVEEFVDEGMIEDCLAVFPVSKSTHMLFINDNEFRRFSEDTGAEYGDLSTWEGFFDVAKKYYQWSEGRAFCAFDYLLRSVELDAQSEGAPITYKDGWYDFEDPGLQEAWMKFAEPLAAGHIRVSDLYANTQVMTGEVAAGISSSAAVLYYNDTVTYPDNTSEPLDVEILPMPQNEGGKKLATQAGVGLCGYKTTEQKAEAASVFAHWFTESGRNLDFVAKTGYMPVTKEGFEAISGYEFELASYETLYDALQETGKSCTMVTEPAFADYYSNVYALYDELRILQTEFEEQRKNGGKTKEMARETWKLFESIR